MNFRPDHILYQTRPDRPNKTNNAVIKQYTARSGMDMKMAKTCYHSHYGPFIVNENLGIHEVVSIIQYFDFESEYLSTQQLAAATSMLGSRVGIYGLLLALP
ncbi:hypothetical protein Tco_0706807 [Tanacetum coccineum]|uniref:Uncharacterized protein n=1 Tax=Tanacetum coccineum TaxID=301880 RepID=A0ABQ4YA12_9ASTR